MNFAEIKRLKDLLKTLQESGEKTTKTRMDVGNAIEAIRKERAAGRTPADVNIEQLFSFLETSFKDPWMPQWKLEQRLRPITTEYAQKESSASMMQKSVAVPKPFVEPFKYTIVQAEPEMLNTRAFTVNLNSNSPLGVQRRLNDKAINEIATADLPQETKERVLKKLTYRRKILDNAEQEFGSFSTTTGMARELTSDRVIVESNIRNIVGLKLSGTSIWSQKELDDLLKAQFVKRNELDQTISKMKAGLPLDRSTSKKLESIDDSIYKMGATRWDEKKGVPLDWLNTNKAYETPTAIEHLSGQFFTGARIPGTFGTDLLSSKDPEKVLNKASIFTQKQWKEKEAAQQELQFINNYLLDPEMAAEYAKTAPFSFFKYWSKKGGTLGLKEHMQSLKTAARAEDEEFIKAKWGALTTVKDVKDKNFAFASLRGQVTELWDPSSPKISQVGLFQDATGEKIKFTVWKNQQNFPKVEAGKNYYFGNVASQEWQGRWNLNINQFSAIEEIKPMPFNTAPPLIVPGSKVDLRDYSKPYSIDPTKGTITYTTKSGKVVEMPIQKTDMTPLKKTRLGDEPGDLAAFLPLAGVPFLQGNVTGGSARIDSISTGRRTAGEDTLEALTGAYNVLGELGSIWYRKAGEANERANEISDGSFAEKGTRLNPWAMLELLGGALYPLSYPQQAISGEASGIGALEGIRQEIRPSQVLGEKDPLIALGEDILLDPLNLIGVGATGKAKKFSTGLNLLVKSERAELLPTSNELKYFEEIAKIKGQTVEEYMAALEAIPETKMPLAPTKWESTKPATKPKIPKSEAPKTEIFETGKYDFRDRAIISTGVHENQATTTTSEQVFETMRFRSQYYPGYPADFFQKKYGAQYNKLKSEYIAAEGVTAEQFENIAKTDPTFADKMTTWAYGEYGRDLKDKSAWDFFNYETQKAEPILETAKPTPIKTKGKGSSNYANYVELEQFKQWQTYNSDPNSPLSFWLKDHTPNVLEKPPKEPIVVRTKPDPSVIKQQKAEEHAATIANRKKTFQDEVDALLETEPEPVKLAPEVPTPWKEPRIRDLPEPKKEQFIDWNKAAKKGMKTAAIGISTGLLFGLPNQEREYNKPQARESLNPSWERGFWESFGDAATYDNYIEGAAMLNAYNEATDDTKRFVPEDRITPSMVLGIQNRDTSFFSPRGIIGTWFVDMPAAPTSYLKAPKIVKKGLDEVGKYAGSKMGEIGEGILEQTTKIKNQYSPDLWGQPGGYSKFLNEIYDPALSSWKYLNTLARGAYYITNLKMGLYTNFIGGVEAKDYYQATKLLLGFDKNKVINKETGKEGWQVLNEIKNAKGISGVSGAMDVQPVKNKYLNIPIKLAQAEESFLRTPVYIKAIREGKTPQEALELVYKYQGNYVDFSAAEQSIAKRIVPFYAAQRFSQPLMFETILTNPGKIFQIEKVEQAATQDKPIPAWAGGSFNWWSPDNPDNILSTRTPLSDTVDLTNDPVKYGVNSLIPVAKIPIELYTGRNYYTNRSFDPDQPIWHPGNNAWSNLAFGSQGYVAGNVNNIVQGKDITKSELRLIGVSTGKTRTATNTQTAGLSDKEMYRRVTGRPNDFTYEQRLQLMQRDNWASAQSGISGKFEQLQGGHVYPAALGGPPLPWNYITQTREENMEWLSAQNYIENLPERELQQEEAWGRVEQEYSASVEEINTRTLDTQDRPENEAQKEKKRYEIRKAENIKIYNRQLNTVRSAIRSAEKDLRGEKKKVEDARAKGYSDPASEAQLKVIEAVLTEHRALYEKVSGLRDAEQGKEFELPVQGTDLSRFQPMDIGGYDKYAVRYGRGPELAKPEDIEKLVDLKKIAAYYAATKSYGPVAGFRPGTPESVKNRILFTRDPRYQELAQIANPLISGAGWEGISGKNYIGPRNISELRDVVEGSVSEPELITGTGEPPSWYSDQQASQESGQAAGFDYNDPEFREVVREIVQETLSEGIISD